MNSYLLLYKSRAFHYAISENIVQIIYYDEIKEITGASKGTICYHCGEGQKEKKLNQRRKDRAKQHPFKAKIGAFSNSFKLEKSKLIKKGNTEKVKLKLKIETFHKDRKNNNMYQTPTFTSQDVVNKFGEKPKCYLTGQEIDIYDTKSYHFDHIEPVSKGGSNSIDNLGICVRNANLAKHDMSLEDFLLLCSEVLTHNGHTVTKN